MDEMADAEDPVSAPPSSAKPRISYACEACRVAKVKCQPGNVEDVCRRCSASKRECIFKLGPRTRRRRSKFHPAATRSTPPPSAPSKTFTINVPMPAEEGVDEGSDLIQLHDNMIQNLIDAEVLPVESSTSLMDRVPSSTSGSRGLSTSAPSSSGSRSAHGFSSLQPRFNLDSAASLLDSFRNSMLPYFPIIFLPSHATIPTLARERPFVLLAMLAAASGGRSLQGHNLYDEEFRKVLGLKFVSGGERSLELLTGLLIYCAWYPFHLRPKNKQAWQYIRMASDIVRDLDLDQPQDGINIAETKTSPERLHSIRAYLAAQYLCSGFAATWQKNHALPFQDWTAACCDILIANDEILAAKSDHTLAWLVRLQHFVAEAMQMNKSGGKQRHEGQHTLLILKGMEAQLLEFQSQLSPELSSQPIIHLTNLTTKIILYGCPLLISSFERAQKRDSSSPVAYADPERLFLCATVLRTWYDYILSMPASEFSHFPGAVWGQLVVSIIMGLRLSFPMPIGCPGWDHAAARRVLNLGDFLARFSDAEGRLDNGNLVPASCRRSTGTDVLCASKVVVDMVRRKYETRLAALEMVNTMHSPQLGLQGLDKSTKGCPMLDGSLDQYISDWDERFFDPTAFVSPVQGMPGVEAGYSEAVSGTGPHLSPFHDLWATMTVSWSQDGYGNVGFNDV